MCGGGRGGEEGRGEVGRAPHSTTMAACLSIYCPLSYISSLIFAHLFLLFCPQLHEKTILEVYRVKIEKHILKLQLGVFTKLQQIFQKNGLFITVLWEEGLCLELSNGDLKEKLQGKLSKVLLKYID